MKETTLMKLMIKMNRESKKPKQNLKMTQRTKIRTRKKIHKNKRIMMKSIWKIKIKKLMTSIVKIKPKILKNLNLRRLTMKQRTQPKLSQSPGILNSSQRKLKISKMIKMARIKTAMMKRTTKRKRMKKRVFN